LALYSLMQSELTHGVIIATCCHNRCDLRTYVNPSFLDSLGFTKDYEKNWVFKTTSWAVSGAYNVEEAGEMSLRKTITGYKAKRILDFGRGNYQTKKSAILKFRCDLEYLAFHFM
jgi:hypothetical protein